MKISDPRKNIIVASIGVLLVALTLVSCEKRDDYYGRGDNGYSETIGFRVVDPMTQTRNHRGLAKVDNEAIDYKTVLRSDNSSDSLHLTTYVGDMNSQQYLMTRASAFTTTNLANFVVYGYNSKSEPFSFSDNFIAGSEAIKQTNGTWRFSPDVVWPSGKSDFFAVANIDNNTGVTISTANNATPSLTYVVPEFATQLDDQGTSFRYNHKDVVVARSGIQEANTGLVPLNFQHIFTAVQFKFGEIKKAGQIHSISIEGIHLNGSLDLAYESASGFMAMNAWSYNDNGTASFSLPLGDNMNITGGDGENGNDGDAIGTLENGFALMMIPQTLEGAKLIIEYTPEGSDTEVEMKASLIGTWAAGKVVTYTISIAEILDLWFNNTTEICLDAHYVMDNKLSVHIGEDVTKNRGTWTLTSSEDWLTIKTDRTDLQKEGYWIIEDKGSMSLDPQTTKGDLNIWLFAKEHIGNESRTATLTLSNSKNNDKRTFKITQMCPYWNGNIGSERIEEYPSGFETGVPWGPYWDGKSYSIVYDVSSGNWLEDAIVGLIYQAWFYLFGGNQSNDYVTITSSGWTKFTFNYTGSVSKIVANTLYPDGLLNTKGAWNSDLAAAGSFEQALLGNSNVKVESGFEQSGVGESAILSAIKKNAFHHIQSEDDDDVYIVDLDPELINWYLPSKEEAISGVYVENAEQHKCETSFINGKFWTSSSDNREGSVIHAYVYDFKTNDLYTPIDRDDCKKSVLYRARAIRKKD